MDMFTRHMVGSKIESCMSEYSTSTEHILNVLNGYLKEFFIDANYENMNYVRDIINEVKRYMAVDYAKGNKFKDNKIYSLSDEYFILCYVFQYLMTLEKPYEKLIGKEIFDTRNAQNHESGYGRNIPLTEEGRIYYKILLGVHIALGENYKRDYLSRVDIIKDCLRSNHMWFDSYVG